MNDDQIQRQRLRLEGCTYTLARRGEISGVDAVLVGHALGQATGAYTHSDDHGVAWYLGLAAGRLFRAREVIRAEALLAALGSVRDHAGVRGAAGGRAPAQRARRPAGPGGSVSRSDDLFATDMGQRAEWLLGLVGDDPPPAAEPVQVPALGLLEGLPEHVYHSDPCAVPSLSASTARVLLQRSPLHAWHLHPRLGGAQREQTATMSLGTLLHASLLGAGPEVVPVEARSKRVRAWTEGSARVLAAGGVPVLASELEEHECTVATIRERLAEHGIALGVGQREVSVFWRSGDGVQCRGRLDHLDQEAAVITDLKTIRSADRWTIERHCEEYGYDVQRAAYVEALEAVRPELAGRVRYRWAFVEPSPPHAVVIAEPDGELRELGEARWRRAVATWAECLRTGTWPGYTRPGEVQRVGAVPWALKKEIGL